MPTKRGRKPAKKATQKNPARAAKRGAKPKLMFTIERVPIPARADRDPETATKARNTLKRLEKGESFVVPKSKSNTVLRIGKVEFGEYKLSSITIQPDKKFVRIFRKA